MPLTVEQWSKLKIAAEVFTPGQPIDKSEFFAGRAAQLERIAETVVQKGRNPIVFGKRGVGKTSLANIVAERLRAALTVKVQCDGSDNFRTIWERAFANTTIQFREQAFGLSKNDVVKKASLSSLLQRTTEHLRPSDVVSVLSMPNVPTMFIFDEFDQVQDSQTRTFMADLIKSISDAALNSTLLIVGVGDSIKHLVGEHPSIERNLVQIEVPKMSDEEISQIFLAGMAKLQISTDKDIADEVARLADGYPHYAHLLGLNSAKACIKNDSLELTRDLFQIGCDLAIQDSIEKYRMVFSCATATAQASRYPEILCACALADGDDRGVFRATAVVDAMNLVFNAEVKVQSVVPALGEFCSLKRGPVLEKVQVGNYSHYRFCDSMMRPFLRIKAQAMLRTLYGDAEI